MSISNEIKIIRRLLNITQTDLAMALNVTYESINKWENGKMRADNESIEKMYNFAFKNGVYFNDIYVQLFNEQLINKNKTLIFHGSDVDFELPIKLDRYNPNSDFGIGFYTTDSFGQAVLNIANKHMESIYAFSFNERDLKVLNFDIDVKWMIAVAYYRGWLGEYSNHSFVKKIVSEVENADVIFAPICDNRSALIINEFISGISTDLQCVNALKACGLKYQYVFRNEKALNKLELISDLYICKEEKSKYINDGLELNNVGLNQVKFARIEYKGKGLNIGQLLK